ncbi:MAG: SEC-C domain-containing protein, partial [Nitrospinae bacterium]|nr:SEC-C domain-containing protein [Nitrospinota bacterium]
VVLFAKNVYKEKEERTGSEKMRELEKFVMLRTLALLWMDHLETMDSLRDSVRLRAYGQKDPLVEYKREGRVMFERLLDNFQTQVVLTIFKVELKETPQARQVPGVENRGEGASKSSNVKKSTTTGRNDPCHCGSGKKYKKCCG